MLKQTFLGIMGWLTSIFGYSSALMIKDTVNYLSGVVLGMLIMTWIFSHAILEVMRTPKLDPDIALVKVGYKGTFHMQAYAKSPAEVIEVLFGYIILKLSPKKTSVRFKSLKYIRFTVIVAIIIFILLGFSLSYWHYMPIDANNYLTAHALIH